MNYAAFSGGRRGVAACPQLLAVCSESRPAMSFPEQSIFAGDGVVAGALEAVVEGESLSVLIESLSDPAALLLAELMGSSGSSLSYPTFDKCQVSSRTWIM